jgi:uncharacterized protein YhhL (DUF1145 family)
MAGAILILGSCQYVSFLLVLYLILNMSNTFPTDLIYLLKLFSIWAYSVTQTVQLLICNEKIVKRCHTRWCNSRVIVSARVQEPWNCKNSALEISFPTIRSDEGTKGIPL